MARFNVISGVPGYFVGLPIPAAGGVLATLALFHTDIQPWVLMASTLGLALLMVSTVKYPNFKKFGLPKNAIWSIPLVVLIAVGLGVAFPNQLSKIIFVPLLLYALYGLKKNVNVQGRLRRRKRRGSSDEETVRSKRSV